MCELSMDFNEYKLKENFKDSNKKSSIDKLYEIINLDNKLNISQKFQTIIRKNQFKLNFFFSFFLETNFICINYSTIEYFHERYTV